MAYMVTYHGVAQKTFDCLKSRVESFNFQPPNETQGIVSSPEADIAFRYSADSKTLVVSIRRRPSLMSHGHLYGMIADAILELGAEPTDALAS